MNKTRNISDSDMQRIVGGTEQREIPKRFVGGPGPGVESDANPAGYENLAQG